MNEIENAKRKAKMKRKEYEKELRNLQTELCRFQEWVKLKGLRVIVVFEGRDAAGKGGTIKAITERVIKGLIRGGLVPPVPLQPVRFHRNSSASAPAASGSEMYG